MAIDDFEWQADMEITEPSRARRAEARAESWLSRLRSSVWLAPALRLLGMGALLTVLAGIGVVATTYAKPGRPLPDDVKALTLALGTSWLKPTAPEASARAPSPHTAEPTVAPSAAPLASAASVGGSRAIAPSGTAGAPASDAPAAGVLPDGRVVLNLASATELTRLPGVGARRAEAIVTLRTKLKRFKQPTDLLRVKGIGPRGLKRMLPHLVLDPP